MEVSELPPRTGPCPNCSGTSVARWAFGNIALSPEEWAEVQAGIVLIGGNVKCGPWPDYRCLTCGCEWGGDLETPRMPGDTWDYPMEADERQ
jgi:hypothetical protein